VPRYEYRCTECNETSVINHLSSEIETNCPKCEANGSLVKALTRFHTKISPHKKQKTGDITEKFIQDSRQELKQQKKELNKVK
jgi:putative FmdB family regulatory protein